MFYRTTTLTLPAYWASAIINNDWSGLSAEDAAELQGFYDDNPHLGGALDVGEPYTARNVHLCEVADYVFPVRETSREVDGPCAY